MPEFLLISEAALDGALATGAFDPSSMLPEEGSGIHKFAVGESTVGFKLAHEPPNQVLALIEAKWLAFLQADGGMPSEVFRRVARVLKGMKSPPVQYTDSEAHALVEEFIAGEDGKLRAVRLRHADTGETEEMEVGGAFVAIGHIPRSELVADQVETDHRVCDEVRLVPTPGHTPEHMTFLVTDTAVAEQPIHRRRVDDADGKVDSRVASPTFTYTENGLFRATLKVTDQRGRSASDYVEILVGNTPPVVELVLTLGPVVVLHVAGAAHRQHVLRDGAVRAADGGGEPRRGSLGDRRRTRPSAGLLRPHHEQARQVRRGRCSSTQAGGDRLVRHARREEGRSA